MKNKIKERLKAKFPGVNLSQKRIDAIADRLESKVKEESEIDQALDDMDSFYPFADIAKEDDRVRSLEAKSKPEPKPNDPKPEPTPSPDDPKDEVPAWAKSLIEQNKTLQEKIQGIESVKTLESRKSVLEKKLEGLPEKVKSKFVKDFNRMSFSNDDEFNTFLTETESDIAEIKQDISNQNVKAFGKPILAGGKTEKEPPKEEVKSIVGDLMKN